MPRHGIVALLVLLVATSTWTQFGGIGGFLGNILRPFRGGGGGGGIGGGIANIFRPQGVDSLFPDDCGRDDKGMGKLCFGDAVLCRQSKLGMLPTGFP